MEIIFLANRYIIKGLKHNAYLLKKQSETKNFFKRPK
jgi:hypothetical protein